MITNILLAVLVLFNLAFAGMLLFAFLSFKRLYDSFIVFITPEEAGKLSPAAKVVEVAADMIGRSVVATAKTTFMGIQSGAVRAEQAIQGNLAEDVMGASPLGSIIKSFPAVGKTLKRNPQLLDLALTAIASRFGKGGPAGSSLAGNGGSTPKFNL